MFERTQVGADGLRVDTVIDFQDEEKEKFFTDLYEWIESVVLPDVEVTHSFVWGERKSFAFYTGDFYELPNNDGWERSDSTLSSIRLSRIRKHHEISIEIMLFPLFAKAMRSGMDAGDILKSGKELKVYTRSTLSRRKVYKSFLKDSAVI